MGESTFWRNLFRPRTQDAAVIDVLATIPVFQGLERRELKTIAELIHDRQYQPDEVVFSEGDPGTGLYIITKGSVSITLTDRDQTQVELAHLVEGDFFGETTMVDGGPRTAGARALEPTELLGFFRPDLLEVIDRYPKIGAKILLEIAQVLSGRLRQTNLEIKRMSGDIRVGKKRESR